MGTNRRVTARDGAWRPWQVTKLACPTTQKLKAGLAALFKDVIRKVRICKDPTLRAPFERRVEQVPPLAQWLLSLGVVCRAGDVSS
jgi:hypothetical protein